MEAPAQSLLSAATLQDERYVYFSQKAEYYSIPSHVNRSIYLLLAVPTVPHKLPV